MATDLLSRYRSIRRPTTSNSGLSTIAKRQQSAEDAIVDNQYKDGLISAEYYLTKLSERSARSGVTPLQKVSLNEKMVTVKEALADAQVQNLYASGKATSAEMYEYEKAKLDKMTEVNSSAYQTQAQKVQSLLDKSEKEARTEYRVSVMKQISEMPEDTSEKLAYKAQMYETLAAQARIDGDIQQADTLETQKNNYVQASKRAGINDYITSVKQSVSENNYARTQPTAEGGAKLIGYSGVRNSAIDNALKGLDRAQNTINSLYVERENKQAMVEAYSNAIENSDGDQRTQLTIALNNLQDDLASIDNQIEGQNSVIESTVSRIQEAQAVSAKSQYKSNVSLVERQFSNMEKELDRAFTNGKMSKYGYELDENGNVLTDESGKPIESGYIVQKKQLEEDRLQKLEEIANGFSELGDEDSASRYWDKIEQQKEKLQEVETIYQDREYYEPIFIDKGKDAGSVKLMDVRYLKQQVAKDSDGNYSNNSMFNQRYINIDGVYHLIWDNDTTVDANGLPTNIPGFGKATGETYVWNTKKDKDGNVIGTAPDRVVDFRKDDGTTEKTTESIIAKMQKSSGRELIESGDGYKKLKDSVPTNTYDIIKEGVKTIGSEFSKNASEPFYQNVTLPTTKAVTKAVKDTSEFVKNNPIVTDIGKVLTSGSSGISSVAKTVDYLSKMYGSSKNIVDLIPKAVGDTRDFVANSIKSVAGNATSVKDLFAKLLGGTNKIESDVVENTPYESSFIGPVKPIANVSLPTSQAQVPTQKEQSKDSKNDDKKTSTKTETPKISVPQISIPKISTPSIKQVSYTTPSMPKISLPSVSQMKTNLSTAANKVVSTVKNTLSKLNPFKRK